MFTLGAGSVPQIRSGKLRALAITSLEPSPLFPGLPTVASAGLTGYELLSIFGMFAPAATPPAVVARLNEEIVRILQLPEARDRLAGVGVEAIGTTPQVLAAAIRSEVTRMQDVIRSAGIREE